MDRRTFLASASGAAFSFTLDKAHATPSRAPGHFVFVIPTIDEDLRHLQETPNIAAVMTTTQFRDRAKSFWLDDRRVMDPFVAALKDAGVGIICVHKGLPLAQKTARPDTANFASCIDVGSAARMYPDMTFVISNAGYDPAVAERNYDVNVGWQGANAFIRSLKQSGIGPDDNVYAEVGAAWRHVMNDPDQAGHFFGKLLGALGEDNILWGNTPREQIEAFRAFQISDAMQARYGYPALNDRMRVKILSSNASRVFRTS